MARDRASNGGVLKPLRVGPQCAIGLVLGAAGAAAVSTVLPAALFGSEGMDPLLLAGAVC